MAQLQQHGTDPISRRQLFHLGLHNIEDLPALLGLPSKHFALLLAWDARGVQDQIIRQLARQFIAQGLAYLCAWGPDCGRVHDMFDLAFVEENRDASDEFFIMTTWHDDETLEDALWDFLYVTYPPEAYADTCKTGLAISVGNDEWARTIIAALSDPATFSERVLKEESGGTAG